MEIRVLRLSQCQVENITAHRFRERRMLQCELLDGNELLRRELNGFVERLMDIPRVRTHGRIICIRWELSVHAVLRGDEDRKSMSESDRVSLG
mmetsp:Transcript_9670/g.19743  ORF Transcript_9670/g.19743 Transcript_9670/m.19743 type:complete len:93 (+) Transcript_9670:112-390(+)